MKHFAFLLILSTLLVACAPGLEGPPGPQGPEGPMGPPGPAGPLGPAGGDKPTYEINATIYVDDQPAEGVKIVRASISGRMLSIRTTVTDPYVFNEGTLVWIIPSQGPSGWAKDYTGLCKIQAGDRAWETTLTAEWAIGPGGKWAVRCVGDQLEMGERKFLAKRFPWSVRTGDSWLITIPLP